MSQSSISASKGEQKFGKSNLLGRQVLFSHRAVAQSVEHHSKVQVWCISTDEGFNHPASLGSWQKIPAVPSAPQK